MTYESAVQSCWNGKKVVMENTIQQWHLELVNPEPGSQVTTEPTIVRVQSDGKRIPWKPTSADILTGSFLVKDGEQPENVVLDEDSWQQAVSLLRQGVSVRKTDWKPGMHLKNGGDKITLVLPNGKEIPAGFIPDGFDIVGRWERF